MTPDVDRTRENCRSLPPGPRSAQHPEPQVGAERSGIVMGAFEPHRAGAGEQAGATAGQDRHDNHLDLVHQPGFEALPSDVGADRA